jgi:hypothetical protein
MQPLDNGPFNSLKAAYRKELKTLDYLNDSRPIDKINFISAYSKARSQGLTEQNIKSPSELPEIDLYHAVRLYHIRKYSKSRNLPIPIESWLQKLAIIQRLHSKPAAMSEIWE